MSETTEKPMTKAQLISALAEKSGVDKKDVISVLDSLPPVIQEELNRAGSFKLSDLLKIDKKVVPAREAKTGVPNPFKPAEKF